MSIEEQVQAKVIELRAQRAHIQEQIQESRRAVEASKLYRAASALRLAESGRSESRTYTPEQEALIRAAGHDPAVLARCRGASNLTEYKKLKAGGASVNLTAVGPDGKPVKDVTPLWTDYIQGEREAGRLPEHNVISFARGRGIPIKGPKDFQRVKVIMGGGNAA